VRRDVACATCHSNETGFTGPVDLINRTVVAYPGSNGTLVSARKPQSYGYAAFAPSLHYNESQKELYGGNFWDMRATGSVLGNPAAEQALGPPVNPLEMALPDAACAVYRMSQSRYRRFFEIVWGVQSFAIQWPADVERVCATPGPAPAQDSLPVHLSAADRGIAAATYNFMGAAIAAFEASPDVSPFSSKFDSALAHPERNILSADERAGWALFSGKANCSSCHLDGRQKNGQALAVAGVEGKVADAAPLFTDFTAANLGVPKNTALRYYCEDKADRAGYTPNRDGLRFLDRGVGAFLRSPGAVPREWARLADGLDGAQRVPTLRNVDMRPHPGFTKAYMHNGYLKSLKEVVHFYNTRDQLPRCHGPGDPGEKVRCWPPPEVNVNVDSTVGRLGLTEREEDQIVAFLKTLTDVRRRP
jgi:cytochrome c peroxidase